MPPLGANMTAERTTKKQQRDGTLKISTYRGRVHKILHCRSSENGLHPKKGASHCGASWDRDVNASRNLLMLTKCQIFGVERPAAFCRKKTTTQSINDNTVCATRQAESKSVMGDLKHLFA